MSDPSFDCRAAERGDFDYIQPGMLIRFRPYGSRHSTQWGIVMSNVFLQVGYLVKILHQGKIRKIKVQWIEKLYV
tara:strand:+ start:1154 stop:1378 length:225 start_codon:yes stop_codon:yes gene_type:complete